MTSADGPKPFELHESGAFLHGTKADLAGDLAGDLQCRGLAVIDD
ncbi:hypothetical protein [Arthrobacter ruber]|nr:hypothetical protein [Arthrobacter ruber]